MEPTYFTCTLGQATALGLTNKNFKSITHFITSQAKVLPDKPAVGFAVPPVAPDDRWESSIWSFSEVSEGSQRVAAILDREHGELLRSSRTVALICPSTPEFLFTWLALMRLGFAVLLIAPQCQPAAIMHLCKSCETIAIFHDETYALQAQEAAAMTSEDGGQLMSIALPFGKSRNLSTILAEKIDGIYIEADVKDTDVAYLHHTSGTSSGVPKPIPQTHRAGVGVLPTFASGKDSATFTTTPLYHGGIADLFRAWTSGALIWLFPGKGLPISGNNIVKCLDVAADATKHRQVPPVKYFSSVPYVLQMLEADTRGLKYLQNMDIVGVGGAALPAEVGDRMVDNGVNLISRFGSAECGFLMSSHRDYSKDKEWQFLRSNAGVKSLKFEEHDNERYELIVLGGWPHIAKTNREDGSFATADLFALHKAIPNAWKYDSRADSQLTLIIGKKFDPAPLEGAISISDLLDDVLIFGNGRPFPGILLFRSEAARKVSDAALTEAMWALIEKLNTGSQDHARIPRRMLVAMPVLDSPLEKSSKGTIIRRVTETRFAGIIEDAYNNMSSTNIGSDVSDEDIPSVLINMIRSIVLKKAKLDTNTDLFSYGIDSVAGMQVRYGMRQLLPQSSEQLPINVVEDCGTVDRLAKYIIRQRHGQKLDQDDDDECQLMLQLVDKYSNFRPFNGDDGHANSTSGHRDNARDKDKDVIVLTGATGALGAHVLSLYRAMNTVVKIYCLVRASDQSGARDRVSKSLEQRGLEELGSKDSKIEVLQASLGDQQLGLSDRDYERLAAEVTIVVHVAWSVNFRMRLRSFVDENISSVTNLINLALSSSNQAPAKFAFCSSVASAMAYSGSEEEIPELIIGDPTAATTLGYSRSKWVAEQICARAGEQTPLRGLIAVFRVGQLAGDTGRGIWNTKEAWPIMLSSVKLTDTLPMLEEETLSWLPVDIAAAALTRGIAGLSGSGEKVSVLHILNENCVPKWADLLKWLKEVRGFGTVSPSEWVKRLEDAQERGGADHPAFKLLGLWKKAYLDEKTSRSGGQNEAQSSKSFALVKTKALVPSMRAVMPVDRAYFLKLWHWIDSQM